MEQKSSFATLTFYRFTHHRYWAFNQMVWGVPVLAKTDGVIFSKVLGCGGGDGFSAWPNFSLYAHFTAWDDKASADRYFDEHPYHQKYLRKTAKCTIYELLPVHGHGEWKGENPFTCQQPLENTDWAVLTRARIRTRRMLEFWRKVPSVSQMIAGMQGMDYAVGIGELPWIEQATFSVWKGADAIKRFAYRKGDHQNVIKMTRERNWYKEEMFMRFNVLGKREIAGKYAHQLPAPRTPGLLPA
jgi:hypothetical protein